jgi:hypothetical protein
MKKTHLFIIAAAAAISLNACGTTNKEPTGDSRETYDWLMKECSVNEKLIEESNYTKSASQLGRRNYCTEAEEMRERITGIEDSTAPGAKDF